MILACMLLIKAPAATAGGIRKVSVNDTKMQSINLRMGKATVLRFAEKPKKVVIGNQNYYSVEFIDNDLTIQPIGDVETNLFVYTPYHTYGFILRVCQSCRSDDLVFVKWKSKYKPQTKKKVVSKTPGFKSVGKSFAVDKKLTFTVVKTIADGSRHLRIFDILVKNESSDQLNTGSLRFVATRNKQLLSGQGFVVGKEVIEGGGTSRARLFLSQRESNSFTLNAFWEDQKSKVIIGREFLK